MAEVSRSRVTASVFFRKDMIEADGDSFQALSSPLCGLFLGPARFLCISVACSPNQKELSLWVLVLG